MEGKKVEKEEKRTVYRTVHMELKKNRSFLFQVKSFLFPFQKNQESANFSVNLLRHKNLLLKLSFLGDNGFKDCVAEWKREDSVWNRIC
ncbi:hypothetical protein CEXT_42881 [Caerostris extrusa]|uniref:Uncharacterized protein n=1 Tax=Caerostris extrusa TaxID=172846 RepID=A0AAV4TU71_CAEEX|nr:hypothetical protein CEXT_42881 [Caerostris extrusa]